MKIVKIFMLCFVFSIGLGGCAVYKIPTQNPKNGNIETYSTISGNSVIANRPYKSIERVKFVVLRVKDNDRYNSFMRAMLKNIGFAKVLSEDEFEDLVTENKLGGNFDSIYDLESLHEIYKELGEYLVITTSLNRWTDSWWKNEILIVDPEKPEILAKVLVQKINWLNMDKEFNYPAVNFINDWYKSSK